MGMTPSSLQAAIGVAVVNVVSLIVSFGVLSSAFEGAVITAATSVVTVAFLIANGLHAKANAVVKASGK